MSEIYFCIQQSYREEISKREEEHSSLRASTEEHVWRKWHSKENSHSLTSDFGHRFSSPPQLEPAGDCSRFLSPESPKAYWEMTETAK